MGLRLVGVIRVGGGCWVLVLVVVVVQYVKNHHLERVEAPLDRCLNLSWNPVHVHARVPYPDLYLSSPCRVPAHDLLNPYQVQHQVP